MHNVRPTFCSTISISIMQWLKLSAWEVGGCMLWHSSFKETKSLFSAHSLEYFRDQEVACLASDRQGSNFESLSHSSHYTQEVLLAQFGSYVYKGEPKPHLFIHLNISMKNL